MFIVTGGGTGIGRALSTFLANERDKEVIIIGRRTEPLVETAQLSPRIQYLTADVATEEGRRGILKTIAGRKLEGVIHNAGVISPIAALSQLDYEEWKEAFEINLHAPLFLTQALLPALQKHQGRVLMIGTGAAHFPVQGWAAYCSSKAALSMLTRCWQLECPEIGFASVMPGIVDTNMQALIRHTDQMAKDKRDFFQQLKDSHRLLKPEIVAQFLGWLLLDLDQEKFNLQEWDIYDQQHHRAWLKNPNDLPHFETNEGS